MHFHGVFLGSQHESWSKQHNVKVSLLCRKGPLAPLLTHGGFLFPVQDQEAFNITKRIEVVSAFTQQLARDLLPFI
jgi:hypothetical protein